MSSFIATIGKESTENLDICIESSCFGITIKGNTANSHAKEAQIGDKLYFWVSGSGYDGYAQISKVEEVSSNSKIPNWTKPKQVNEIQNPWSFLLHFDNYTKLNERKYFSFVDGVQEITGVKQAWLLQSLIRLPEGFEINMDKALLNNEEVEVKEESKEEAKGIHLNSLITKNISLFTKNPNYKLLAWLIVQLTILSLFILTASFLKNNLVPYINSL